MNKVDQTVEAILDAVAFKCRRITEGYLVADPTDIGDFMRGAAKLLDVLADVYPDEGVDQ